jgi:riboflavin biosynthesis pyrimidine reductase
VSDLAPPCLTRFTGPLSSEPAGVAHVAAVWARGDGEYATLRVGEGAPQSESDAIVLSGARARADAIVTTGRILRDEPDLVHASIAGSEVTEALVRWRRALGLDAPPWIAVLTGSGELPHDHPAIAAAARSILFTGAEGAERLRAAPGLPARAEIVECEAPSAARLIAHLRDERGAQSILVEAGARTSATLYEGAGLVDELWLSICCAADLASEQVVGPFVERRAIESTLGAPVHEERHEERGEERREEGREDGGIEWATHVYRRARQRAAGPAR